MESDRLISLAEKDLVVMVDAKLNMSQENALVSHKANLILWYFRRSTGSRLNNSLIPYYLMLVRPNLEYCVWFCSF